MKEYSKPDGRTAGEHEEAGTAPLASSSSALQPGPAAAGDSANAKWQVWNKVELARKLQDSFKDAFYPPKFLLHILKMQSVVRGFLERKKLQWLLQVELRRAKVKELERSVAATLPPGEQRLLKEFRAKPLFHELDNRRFAEAAASMLRNNELQSPYLLARAAAAIFDTVDVDESGELDESEVGQALAMLGIEQLPEADAAILFGHFDRDGSGQIDRAEFQTMVQVLCCGGKTVEDAIKQVTESHPSKRRIADRAPPPHLVQELNPEEMTRGQLENCLHALKTRMLAKNAETEKAREAEARMQAEMAVLAAAEAQKQREREIAREEREAAIRRNAAAREVQAQLQRDREEGRL